MAEEGEDQPLAVRRDSNVGRCDLGGLELDGAYCRRADVADLEGTVEGIMASGRRHATDGQDQHERQERYCAQPLSHGSSLLCDGVGCSH